MRSLIGQYGHVSGLFSCSGGIGISSNCVTLAAPWRLLVPTQSLPVSPPPITITCLPSARIWLLELVAGVDLVLLRQELHREVHAVELAPGHRQVAALLRAAGQQHRVELRAAAHRPLIVSLRIVGDLAALAAGWPTSTPVRNVTPSARICSTRRSMCDFSILKSGMP